MNYIPSLYRVSQLSC